MKELAKIIAGEIRQSGPLTFARFMELALYCPVYGYYEQPEDTIGRRGDFFTSASVGSLFGQLLAFQFSEWLEQIRSTSSAPAAPAPKVQLVEAGAHDGRLAGDILEWLRRHRPGLFERLEFWILEPSTRRREVQQNHLSLFGPMIRWAASFEDFRCTDHSTNPPDTAREKASPPRPSPPMEERGTLQKTSPQPPWVCGVIFSNELLDSFPLHRLGWDTATRQWFEWGVALDAGQLGWTRLPLREPQPADDQLAALAPVLPDGFTIELCPAAVEWWRTAASALRCGKLVTMDYGSSGEERFLPERPQGTARAYYRHHVSHNLLAHPGEQDLTAHVDFTALARAGERAGLTTEHFATQEKFLTDILQRLSRTEAAVGQWTTVQRRQFQTLTHPAHLGRAFRVLVQSRT